MPRLLAPTLLGVYLLMPWVIQSLSLPSSGDTTLIRLAGGAAAVTLIGLLVMQGLSRARCPHSQMVEAPDRTTPTDTDWAFYGPVLDRR